MGIFQNIPKVLSLIVIPDSLSFVSLKVAQKPKASKSQAQIIGYITALFLPTNTEPGYMATVSGSTAMIQKCMFAISIIFDWM